jgi:tetratricopeptide (TPR) repeat protein
LSVVTCPGCGSAWNVAGITGVASVGCQRCGAAIPLAQAPAQPWQPAGLVSGEGIMAMPASPGTPIGENAIPCAHCGTVLDCLGLSVGMSLRCGRCGGVFARPSAAQIAQALGQPAYAPPPPPGPGPMPTPSHAAPRPEAAQARPNEYSSGDLELALKPTTPCKGCGKEYYEEELPEPDDQGRIRCKRCKKILKDLNEEEEEQEEEEEEEEEKPQKGRGPLLGRKGKGGGRAPAKKAPPKEEPPKKVILDDKFKLEVFNAFRAGDEDRAMKRCLELVGNREVQAKQIFDHLLGIAKQKRWLGTAAKPVPPLQAPSGPVAAQQRSGQVSLPPRSGGRVGVGGTLGGMATPPPSMAPLPYQQPQGFVQPQIVPAPAALPAGVEAELPPGLVEVTPIITPAPAMTGAPIITPAPAPAPLLAPPPAPLPTPPPAPAPDPNADPPEKGFLVRVALEGRLAQLELLVSARRFGPARELAQAILAREPRLARAHTLLAEALAGLGDDDAALDAAHKGARLEPDKSEQVRTYAQALARKGRLAEAVNALRRIVGPKKGEAKDAVLLADFVRRLGDEAQAKKIMDEVSSRDPQSLEPMRQTVIARTQARELEAAASELESLVQKEKPPRPLSLACATELARALEQTPEKATPRSVLACARALDACNKTIAAVRLLAPLVQRDPGSVDARRALGLAYARLGAAPLAEEHLKQVAGRGSAGADEFRALGELALERGDVEGATRVLLRARELRPDDAQVRRALARAYEQAGELAKAVEELEQGLVRTPNDRDLETLLASVSERAIKARVSALEARVREAPDDRKAHLELGEALFEKGEAERAFESLARAARDPYLIPRVVELVEMVIDELEEPRAAVVLLKDLHGRAGDLPRAIQTLERYLQDKEDEELRLELLELYAQGQRVAASVEGLLALLPRASRERAPAAIALAQKILEREPMQHDLWRAVALAQRRSGDHEGAAHSLEKCVQAEPGDRAARLDLAQAFEDAGKVEPAFEALRPLVESGEPTADELSYAAALLARLERHADAVPLLRAALKKRDDPALKERLERAEAHLRDREAAALQEQVREGRASEEDRKKLAGLLAESNRRAETLEILRALPGAPPGDGDAVFLRFAAEQFARRGRIDKAEAALRELCTVLAYQAGSEQEKAMLYRIGALYERAGDRRSARRAYLELVARDPHYRDAYQKLEAQEETVVVEAQESVSERGFAEFVENGTSREVKTIFDSLGSIELELDPALLAEARAAATASSTPQQVASDEDEGLSF